MKTDVGGHIIWVNNFQTELTMEICSMHAPNKNLLELLVKDQPSIRFGYNRMNTT